MKTITLSEDEFQLLGSLIGKCFCGDHPLLHTVYDVLNKANGGKFFPEPPINHEKCTSVIYIEAPRVAKVISYNIKAGLGAQRYEEEILAAIKKYKW